MRIAICDDEEKVREALVNKVSKLFPNEYVNIKSWMKNDIYFVEVKNSFDGKLVLDEDSGLPETTKAKENGHGFGLLNVKKTVEKYYGGVDIEQEENSVKLSVMMVVPS